MAKIIIRTSEESKKAQLIDMESAKCPECGKAALIYINKAFGCKCGCQWIIA